MSTATQDVPKDARTSGFSLNLANAKWLPLVAFFVIIGIVFHIATDGLYLSPRNLTLLLRQSAINAVLAMGVAVLIIKGEIDLSIGSAVYLCGTVAAALQVYYGFDVVSTIAVTIMVGLVMGMWQGFWTVALGVPSFVVTLAGLLGFRGLAYYMTDAATISPMSDSYRKLSEGFIPPQAAMIVLAVIFVGVVALMVTEYLRSGKSGTSGPTGLIVKIVLIGAGLAALAWIFGGYRGIPNSFVWVVVIATVLWFIMSRTVFGRNAYLIGSNREAARLSGINVKRHLLGGFLLMGMFYAIGGILVTSRLSASTPALGQYMELDAIAAAVIGGISLRGGIGTIVGAIGGALLLTAIDNGMSLMNISSFIQMVIKAFLLLIALVVDSYYNRRAV